MKDASGAEPCKAEAAADRYLGEISGIANELMASGRRDGCFTHIRREPIPSREAAIAIIEKARRILYPGYFIRARVDDIDLGRAFRQEAAALFKALSEQITLAIRHECLRDNQPRAACEERGQAAAAAFLRRTPALRMMLGKDVRAAFQGDPAAKSCDEIIFSYPGLFAITVYRMANLLHEQQIPLLPRIMAEYAHGMTGIDIHPGARIGESFFIDHGTGVVIGETTVIGNRVRVYQGVTLGALSVPSRDVERLRQEKRHPTIEDDVILYSGATILGGETVIGARSVIGGNVWITESVAPDTQVYLKRPELVFKGKA